MSMSDEFYIEQKLYMSGILNKNSAIWMYKPGVLKSCLLIKEIKENKLNFF